MVLVHPARSAPHPLGGATAAGAKAAVRTGQLAFRALRSLELLPTKPAGLAPSPPPPAPPAGMDSHRTQGLVSLCMMALFVA